MSLENKSPEEIEALASLANDLASNPKTRMGFLQLTKTANPDAAIPEIDIPTRLTGVLQASMKRMDEFEAKMAERETIDRVEAQRREMGLSRDELAKVEKTMVDHKIADHKTAKQFLDMQSRSAEPTPASHVTGVRRFGEPKLPDMKESGGDLKSYSYKNAYAVIDELRGRRAT